MRPWERPILRPVAVAGMLAALAPACHRAGASGGDAGADGAPSPAETASQQGASSVSPPPPPDAPKLAAIALQVSVYEKPSGASRKIGYLRLGAQVARDAKPAGNDGCAGGWYRIHPGGYVCIGEDATLDPNHPLARAASVRPNLKTALPYAYAFVRAVAPLYLKVPTTDEQLKSEFKLKEHLDSWKGFGAEANKVILGANDVPIDERGVPIAGAALGSAGRSSPTLSEGELFGGQTDKDPIPFWLDGSRKVPNVSGFQVPAYAVFANRVRRHTGLALVGSFPTGPESLDRRFAVTVDLRLVPTTKIKPDTGSPFHGLELTGDVQLPVAFVRADCSKEKGKHVSCAHPWRLDGEHAREDTTTTLPFRSVVPLSGKEKRAGTSLFRETKDGRWLKASELGVAAAPTEWPAAAKAGQKWIDISIDNQTLTLWEGQKPVYVTLVSTGQDGMKDPKTTKSTVRGIFKIKNKHITAMMDSNERSSQGGGPAPSAAAGATEVRDRSSKRDEGEGKSDHDDGYGKTVRRGQGSFELRDVPYVQYFEAGYALHAAYWHDVFGTARSHGCVNLAPVDAHRVFLWTDPPVPDGWHGVNAGPETGDGTTVSIHK